MDSLDRVQRETLLRGAVLGGDEAAWQTWYDDTFDDLYQYVRWRCAGRRDWADEIVQETWLTAVRRIRKFDPRQGSFPAWLRGIAVNLLRNHLRKWRTRTRFEQQLDRGNNHDGAETEKAAEREERQQQRQHREQRIAAALDALAPREEAVLRAKYLDGRSVAEIAANGGETLKAVESLLSRARQAFRRAYLGQGDEEHVET
jgi:RNA polymerase sigma-70 factor (ECF subfamily)